MKDLDALQEELHIGSVVPTSAELLIVSMFLYPNLNNRTHGGVFEEQLDIVNTYEKLGTWPYL